MRGCIAIELSQDGGIHRNTDGLAPGLASKPSQHGPVEAPNSALFSIPVEKTIEFPKREFGPHISISQAPFETQKSLQIGGERAAERRCHRGTGRATIRSRRSATRTYTEVDEGRR